MDPLGLLLRDARMGDLASVQARIGADRSLLNARGGTWSFTALEAAADAGHAPIVRYLLDEGAELHGGAGHGSKALRAACLGGEGGHGGSAAGQGGGRCHAR
jgi:hypothetical protein